MDQVVELLGTPPDSIDGGNLTFSHGLLHSTLWIWKDPRGRARFGWSITTYDTALRSQIADFSGMSVRIDHPGPSGEANLIPPAACYPWPTTSRSLTTDTAAAFAQHGHPSLGFVRDRHDLGILLLADQHVHRNGVRSFAPTNNEPARLAQAVLLARHSGDQALEQTALAKLHNNSERPVDPWPDYLFQQAVASWAKRYSKVTDIDLSDLIKFTTRRPSERWPPQRTKPPASRQRAEIDTHPDQPSPTEPCS